MLAYAPGNLYLAGPYRGSSFSVVAIDSALVGPFDLGVVIVRSAVRIDPDTAQASIDATGTDPIPHIIDGVPIHLRDIRAYIDRPELHRQPDQLRKVHRRLGHERRRPAFWRPFRRHAGNCDRPLSGLRLRLARISSRGSA